MAQALVIFLVVLSGAIAAIAASLVGWKLADAPRAELWLLPAATLGAGCFAIVAAWFGASALKNSTERHLQAAVDRADAKADRDRRALAGALAAEIKAVAGLLTDRNFVETLRTQAARIGSQPGFWIQGAPASGNYVTVYRSNAASLGIFPSQLAGEIARLYTFFEGIQDTLNQGWLMRQDVVTPEVARTALNNTATRIEEVIRTSGIVSRYLEKVGDGTLDPAEASGLLATELRRGEAGLSTD